LDNDNRAEAWYQIRYQSNSDGKHAPRRIAESNLFSLYDNPGQGVSEAEAKEVLRMYTVHRTEIQAYETKFSGPFAPTGSNTITSQLLGAKEKLITVYGEGRSIDEVLVGQNDLGRGDTLVGTANGDLLFGEQGTDVLTGGAGTDVLYGGDGVDTLSGGADADLLRGGAGNDTLQGGTGDDDLLEGGAGFDTYLYTTGDGHDRIEDSDASGVIIVNGKTLAGGVKKAGHTDWTSPDGTIKYLMSGTDLIVQLNGVQILTVNEDFQSGQFGTRRRVEKEERMAA